MNIHKNNLSQFFGIEEKLSKSIQEKGYIEPTPIQEKAIPHVLAGRDIIGIAQTGTGKTAAFVLPILQNILFYENNSASPARHPIRILILTPTRELANQVFHSVQDYAKYTNLKSAVVFGGIDIQTQIVNLRMGIELLIATPGRLLDHICKKTINLSQIQILVLDEADRMLDMGFFADLRRIIDVIPKKRQTLLFSATFSSEVQKLAEDYLNNFIVIETINKSMCKDMITQIAYITPDSKKSDTLLKVLKCRITQGLSKRCIIFVNSRSGCDRITTLLENQGNKVGTIHGNKSQIERMRILEIFKSKEIDILVATDVASRGLDIIDMPCVINYELPFNIEDYIHRIGRTGRAGIPGEAIALVNPIEEKILIDIENIFHIQLLRLSIESLDNSNIEFLSNSESQENNLKYLHKTSPRKNSQNLGALLGGIKNNKT